MLNFWKKIDYSQKIGGWLLIALIGGLLSWLAFLSIYICLSEFSSYSCCQANQRNLRAAVNMYKQIEKGGQYPVSLNMLIPHYFYELPECSAGKYQYLVRNADQEGGCSYELGCTVHGQIE